MPRSQAKRSSKTRPIIFRSRNMTKLEPPEDRGGTHSDLMSLYLSNFERDVSTNMLNMHNRYTMITEQIDQLAFEELAIISPENRNKTMMQLRAEKSFSTTSVKSMMYESVSFMKYLNGTTTTTFATNKTKKTVDDEGYLTAGESGNMNGDNSGGGKRTRSSSVTRQSRRTTRTIQVTRTSRSLSRSKLPPKKNVTIQAPEKKTPDKAMKPPTAYGMVTPKVKPNMPVSVFRRPKQGEMALSMQGSPLLVSGVVTETCANVNIPLQDGKILSLQPSRGLRMSEIPDLDYETRQQLSTLRDNLHKVVMLHYNE